MDKHPINTQPMWGSESRVSSGDPAQTCTARYQGGPGHHIYAWMPRGLRCGPWSGQERAFGTWTRMGVFLDERCCKLGCICGKSVRQHLDTGPLQVLAALGGPGTPPRHRGCELNPLLRRCFVNAAAHPHFVRLSTRDARVFEPLARRLATTYK